MSDFSILYRSIHSDQKTTKKTESKVSPSEHTGSAKPETHVNPIKALIAKIF